MSSIAPELKVKVGRGARFGFRDVLRVCIALVETSKPGAMSNGVRAGTAAGSESEAMSGNDGLTTLVL